MWWGFYIPVYERKNIIFHTLPRYMDILVCKAIAPWKLNRILLGPKGFIAVSIMRANQVEFFFWISGWELAQAATCFLALFIHTVFGFPVLSWQARHPPRWTLYFVSLCFSSACPADANSSLTRLSVFLSCSHCCPRPPRPRDSSRRSWSSFPRTQNSPWLSRIHIPFPLPISDSSRLKSATEWPPPGCTVYFGPLFSALCAARWDYCHISRSAGQGFPQQGLMLCS